MLIRIPDQTQLIPDPSHANRAGPRHNDAHRMANAPHDALELVFPKGATVVPCCRLVLIHAEYVDPKIAPVRNVHT